MKRTTPDNLDFISEELFCDCVNGFIDCYDTYKLITKKEKTTADEAKILKCAYLGVKAFVSGRY